jgi:hypothetical protein
LLEKFAEIWCLVLWVFKMRGGMKELDVTVPSYLRCPISLELMRDPVTLCTGITYDRQNIETWLDAGNNVCPITNQALENQEMIPNHTVRRVIQDWCVANSSSGIERIPTPRAPPTSAQIAELLSEIGSREAIQRLRALAKESDRNRKRVASSNAVRVLASVFAAHSVQALNRLQHAVDICEEALGTLAVILPVRDAAGEVRELLTSADSLRCIISILVHGNLEGKKNAVTLLQEIADDNRSRERIARAEGIAEGLVELLREPICPSVAKASISVIFKIATTGRKIRVKLVEAGAVALLVEILADSDSDRGLCERGLAALDVLINCTDGRLAAHSHALTVPVTVKKMLRVSDWANESAVSILWALCQNSSDWSFVAEALQACALQKLLVLVQIGCRESTREKATDVLKLLNKYRKQWECADTMDFSQIRRSF